MGCSAGPTRLWLGGDVQISAPSPQRLAALRALPGVGVVNLEGPIGAGALSARRLFNHATVPAHLVGSGVRVIGVANNHRDDAGAPGRARTRAAIAAADALMADADRAARLTLDGRTVTLVAGEPETVDQMRAHLADEADLRVAFLHVVAPPSYLPEPTTEAAVDALVGAGADVIAVHGSHALGPVTRRSGAIVAWGLGNLAFDCRCTREDEGLVLALTLDAEGLVARVVPIQAGLSGAPARLHPDRAGIIALLNGLGSQLSSDGSVAGVGAQADGE